MALPILEMKLSLNQSVMQNFSVLVHALGIDENDLLDYLNLCLLEHLVTTSHRTKTGSQNLG